MDQTEEQPRPHHVDFRIPDSEWKGYWCPKDQNYHKDGTSFLFNYHCITCKTMLTGTKMLDGIVRELASIG